MGCCYSKRTQSVDNNDISNDNDINILSTINIDSINNFPFSNVKYARVYDAYDADTLSIVFVLYGALIKMKLRVLGVDSPEIKSHNQKLKKRAYEGREYAKKLLVDKIHPIRLIKWDKYGGRVIGELIYNETNYSDMLINNNYAVKYNGKTKCTDEYMINTLML